MQMWLCLYMHIRIIRHFSQALTPVWRTYLYMYVYLYFCMQKGPSTDIAQMYHNSDL